jgi:hypothetical protein
MRAICLGALLTFFACGPVVSLKAPDAFADAVVSFKPGLGAGFGQEELPDVVLGPPQGTGNGMGSLHVLSLGKEGEIVLEFQDMPPIDGPGADFIVFENPFPGWVETGIVWNEFPCETNRKARVFNGCAGVTPVLANGVETVDATNSGGDAFDLAELGLSSARFVRIRDSGQNTYAGTSGGFDLDAVGVIHSTPAAPSP